MPMRTGVLVRTDSRRHPGGAHLRDDVRRQRVADAHQELPDRRQLRGLLRGSQRPRRQETRERTRG